MKKKICYKLFLGGTFACFCEFSEKCISQPQTVAHSHQ